MDTKATTGMDIWNTEEVCSGLFGTDGTLVDDKEHFTGRSEALARCGERQLVFPAGV